MCKQFDETRDHLFREFDYAKALWGRLLQWLALSVPLYTLWNAMQHWILKQTRGKSKQAQVLKLVYTEYIHE